MVQDYVYTPQDWHALVATLLDPLGRKSGFHGRRIQIPGWADNTPLTVVGPPEGYPALVIRHSQNTQFESVSGNVEFRLS